MRTKEGAKTGYRYKPGRKGWVYGHEYVNEKDETKRAWSWWYGPDHGWGTTWGPLDYSVAVFPLRRQLMDAANSCLGRRSSNRAMKVEEAEAIAKAQRERYEARKAAAQ